MTGDKNEVIIDESTFRKSSPEDRDWIIYLTVVSQGKRITAIEKGGALHKALSIIGGAIGATMGFFGSKIFS